MLSPADELSGSDGSLHCRKPQDSHYPCCRAAYPQGAVNTKTSKHLAGSRNLSNWLLSLENNSELEKLQAGEPVLFFSRNLLHETSILVRWQGLETKKNGAK